jgi:hypothetical protein
MESDFDLIMNTPGHGIAHDILLQKHDVRMFNTYMDRLLYRSPLLNPVNENYKGRGFVFYIDSMEVEKCNELKTNSITIAEEPLTWDEESFVWLDKLITLCEERNIRLIPVIGPYTPFYTEERQSQSLEKFSGVFEKHGLHIIDFGNINGIEHCDHFFDKGHLNRAGVAVYLPVFMDTIREHLPQPY